MAASFVGLVGSGVIRGSSSTFSVATSATTAGNLLVLTTVCDSQGTTGPTVTDITKPGNESGAWTLLSRSGSSTGTVNGGVITEIWGLKLTASWPSLSVQVTWSAAIAAKAIIFAEYAGVTLTVRNSGQGVSGSGAPTYTLTGLTAGDLLLGSFGVESPDTTGHGGASGWTLASRVATDGTANTAAQVGQYYRLASAGSHAFDPTLGANDSSVAAAALVPEAGGTTTTTTTTAPAESGTVALSGVGALALTGSPAAPGALNLAGAGALTVTGRPAVAGPLDLTGAGALLLSGSPGPRGVLALSSTGSLALEGVASGAGAGTVALDGAGTLTLAGTPAHVGVLALSGTGTLTLLGEGPKAGALALDGVGALSFAGEPAVAGLLVLESEGSLEFAGQGPKSGTLTLVALGTLSFSGESSQEPPPPRPDPYTLPRPPSIRSVGIGWTVHLMDTMSGQTTPELALLGGSLTDGPLNDATSGSIKVAAAELRQYDPFWWSPWSGSLLFCFGGHPIVAGPILTDPTGYTTVELKSGGLFSLLEHRYATARDFFPGSEEALAASVLSFSGTNLGGIAAGLVRAAQDRPNGQFPIAYASPTEAGSVDRVRNFRGHNISNNAVAKLIKEITNVINGPDVAFRPEWVEPGARARWVMHHGTEGMPQIGQEHTFSIDLTSPRSKITEPVLTKASTQLARVYMSGQGEGETTEMVIVEAAGTWPGRMPMLETVVSDTQASNANGLLTERGRGVVTPEQIVQLSVGLPADDPVMPLWAWHTGDEFIVRVPGTLLHIAGGTYRMRVVSRSADVMSHRVKVELQPEALIQR